MVAQLRVWNMRRALDSKKPVKRIAAEVRMLPAGTVPM